MTHVRATLRRSERRVCRVLEQPRSTQRYVGVPREGEAALLRRMHELVRMHRRGGIKFPWHPTP